MGLFKRLPDEVEREAFIAGECPGCGSLLTAELANHQHHYVDGRLTNSGTEWSRTRERCEWTADDLAAFSHRQTTRAAGLTLTDSWLGVLSPLPTP